MSEWTLDEYQGKALRTSDRELEAYSGSVRAAFDLLVFNGHGYAAHDLLDTADLDILTHGLVGEAGEFAELVKKAHGHGKEFDPVKAVKELGDVLWYLAVLAKRLGFSLEYVARENILKLKTRYPEKFTVAASEARVDVKPGKDEFSLNWALECTWDVGDEIYCGLGRSPDADAPFCDYHNDCAQRGNYDAGPVPDAEPTVIVRVPGLVERVSFDANGAPVDE